ncbi:hypothetical protein JYT23_01170 [Mariprofundus ferrooxydans]|nr:hypothetical protein [Mariprofundus ferrooxydans]
MSTKNEKNVSNSKKKPSHERPHQKEAEQGSHRVASVQVNKQQAKQMEHTAGVQVNMLGEILRQIMQALAHVFDKIFGTKSAALFARERKQPKQQKKAQQGQQQKAATQKMLSMAREIARAKGLDDPTKKTKNFNKIRQFLNKEAGLMPSPEQVKISKGKNQNNRDERQGVGSSSSKEITVKDVLAGCASEVALQRQQEKQGKEGNRVFAQAIQTEQAPAQAAKAMSR